MKEKEHERKRHVCLGVHECATCNNLTFVFFNQVSTVILYTSPIIVTSLTDLHMRNRNICTNLNVYLIEKLVSSDFK